MAESDDSPATPRDDAPGGIWRLEGISSAAREAAEAAAAAEGLSLGGWLETAIREAADGSSAPMSGDDILAAIDALSARIAAAESSAQHSIAPLRARLDELSREIAGIEEIAAAKLPGDDGRTAAGETDEAGDGAASMRTPRD